MKWSDITEVVGKAAPLIGSVIGGPAGAGVGALVASALGVENTPEAVQAALGNPDALVKLKEIESTERQHFLGIQLEYARLDVADRQDARDKHKDSITPTVITAALTVICGVLLYSLLFIEIPEANKDILVQSFGTVLGFWGAAIAYWVGASPKSNKGKVNE